MSACRRPRIPGRRPRSVGADDGFTVLEVMVAMAVISTVMMSLLPLFVISMRVNHQQSDRQAAIQAADDAMERARAIQVSALLTGRDQASTMAQAVAAPEEVQVLLADDTVNAAFLSDPVEAGKYLAWDDGASSGAGPTAILPTTSNLLTVSGVVYQQQWFIGKCGRPTAAVDLAPEDASRSCQAGRTGSGYTPLYRLVVAVDWTDRECPSGCSYVTTSLISSTTEEPVFSIRDSIQRVKITSLTGTQTNDVSVAIAPLNFTASGSNVTWKATGLPVGLTMNAATGVITGVPTVTGTLTTPLVTATDDNSQEDYVTFSWVINKLPTITTPGTTTTPGSVAFTKTYTAASGTLPYTWSWSGVPSATWPAGTPPGLTMNPTTGTVSGTPNVAGTGTQKVTLTVTDKFGQAVSTAAFTWTVAPLAVNAFTVPTTATTSRVGTAINPITVTASGGIPPYVSWSATGLPNGISIDPSTGVISGTPLLMKNFFTVVVTVTDSSADAPSRTASRAPVNWRVWP